MTIGRTLTRLARGLVMSRTKSEGMRYRKKPVVIESFQMTRARRADNSEWPKREEITSGKK
jgi:hypothetical protein